MDEETLAELQDDLDFLKQYLGLTTIPDADDQIVTVLVKTAVRVVRLREAQAIKAGEWRPKDEH